MSDPGPSALVSAYGQAMSLAGRLSGKQMSVLRELDGTLALAEHVMAGTPVGAGAHSTICGLILRACADGQALAVARERDRIRHDLINGDPGRLESAFRRFVDDIGVVENGRLAGLLWMDERIDATPESLAEIGTEIGLAP